jgi:two-component system, LytTR family, response regulator
MKLRAIIVDDEDLARKNLQFMIDDYCPGIEVIGEASNKVDAKALIESTSPDVVFLDIRMPSGSEGFELLESIEKRNFLVVFVTAFKDYAVKAFNSNAIHYLLKPIDADDLEAAVEKIMESKRIFAEHPENYKTYFTGIDLVSDQLLRNKMSSKIAISHTKGIKLVDDSTILHLEASGNCTTIYFDDGTRYLDTRTLKIYENMLDVSKFMRIHKSHMINMEKLIEYASEDGHMAVLKGGKRVPVARNRLSDFLKIIRG